MILLAQLVLKKEWSLVLRCHYQKWRVEYGYTEWAVVMEVITEKGEYNQTSTLAGP